MSYIITDGVYWVVTNKKGWGYLSPRYSISLITAEFGAIKCKIIGTDHHYVPKGQVIHVDSLSTTPKLKLEVMKVAQRNIKLDLVQALLDST